nr:ATP synthase subunit delta, mitochondrial [Peromyscus maniculatus bairdii]
MPTPWPGPRGPRAPPGLTRGYPNPGSDPRRGPPSPAPAHRSHRYPDLVPGQAQTLPGRSSALRTEAGPAGVAWDRPRPWARRGHPSPERAPCRPQPGFCRRALGLARPPSRVPPMATSRVGGRTALRFPGNPSPGPRRLPPPPHCPVPAPSSPRSLETGVRFHRRRRPWVAPAPSACRPPGARGAHGAAGRPRPRGAGSSPAPRCVLQVFFDGANVRQVDVPTLTGAFGILASHVPTLQVLRPGLVVVHAEDGTTTKYFVSSGSVTVNADSSVQVLAEEAVTLDMLDLATARANLEKAQSELSGAADEAARAEIQIRIEANEALVKALE